jgi:hypothetical protein
VHQEILTGGPLAMARYLDEHPNSPPRIQAEMRNVTILNGEYADCASNQYWRDEHNAFDLTAADFEDEEASMTCSLNSQALGP